MKKLKFKKTIAMLLAVTVSTSTLATQSIVQANEVAITEVNEIEDGSLENEIIENEPVEENEITEEEIVKEEVIENETTENERIENEIIENEIIENESVEENEITEEEIVKDEVIENETTENEIIENVVEQPEQLPANVVNITNVENNIVYNLGNVEMPVEFDEYSDFVIKLEDDAFFPYEVQFKNGDDVVVEWFDSADSVVEVFGHEFSVKTEKVDENKLSQISFFVGDDEVKVMPEPKDFVNLDNKTKSLLPITTVDNLTVDLTSYNKFELQEVKVSAILSGMTPGQSYNAEDKVAWVKVGESEYGVVGTDDVLDLSTMAGRGTSFNIEMIVGSANQFDIDNTRYIMKVEVSNIAAEVVSNSIIHDAAGNVITPNRNYKIVSEETYYLYDYVVNRELRNNTLYVQFELDDKYKSFGDVAVYQGTYNTMDEVTAAMSKNPDIDVTKLVLDNSVATSGFKIKFDDVDLNSYKYFTFVFNKDGKNYIQKFSHYILQGNDIWATLNGVSYTSNMRTDYNTKIQTYTYQLESSLSPSANYKAKVRYEYGGMSTTDGVLKIVEGHYDTLNAAASKPDIKNTMLEGLGDGYSANYSGDGKNFTLFADENGEVAYKFTIKIVNSESNQNDIVIDGDINEGMTPHPGEQDLYFRVSGATGLNNAYVLPYEHDDYYDMGYQTIFYYDAMDLNTLKPIFWNDETLNVYSGIAGGVGTKQVSGVTVADFSDGPVQYSVASSDGNGLKNYWITFVKKHTGGAKLFVNGINGADGAKREVFLTDVQKNKHDILIANVGDEKLTGITATLTNAENIKLDDYWNATGNGNELAAFDKVTDVENIAKIRIIPTGEGDIKGTLTIRADGQDDVVIELTGSAGSPKLTSTAIPEAVKYVPYAVQLVHNNKYNWNKVTLSIYSGELPEGMTLNKNGEIYGVPKETGTFYVYLKLDNSDDRLDDSYEGYTIIVNENTNENVDAASDEGYTVKQNLGTLNGSDYVISGANDELFISEGEFGEFIDLWLNGDKLVEGQDYSKEAGSTKITVKSQTFQSKTQTQQVNTIAAEFRVDGNAKNEIKRTSQNFTKDDSNSGGGSDNSGGGSGGGSDNSGGGSGGGGSSSKDKDKEVVKKPEPVVLPVVETAESTTLQIPVNISVVDNVAYGNVTDEQVEEVLVKIAELRKSQLSPIVVEVKLIGIPDGINDVKTSISVNSARKLSFVEMVSLKVDAGELGTVTLNNASLMSVVANGGDTLNIDMSKNGNEITVNVLIDGQILSNIKGGVRVFIPNLAKGEVIILVKTNNSEELIEKSIVKDSDVYALLDGSGTIKVINNSKTFADVNNSDWYSEAVKFVNSRELLVGINDKEFAPQMPTSRAMIAVLLHRLENSENFNKTVEFKDVANGMWYSDSVNWANANNIIVGYENNTFGVNDNITREQLATIMYRYANYVGMDTVERGDTSKFNDQYAISSWANDSVRWAVGVGLMQGNGNNINPQGQATRAEVSVVIMNFIDLLVE